MSVDAARYLQQSLQVVLIIQQRHGRSIFSLNGCPFSIRLEHGDFGFQQCFPRSLNRIMNERAGFNISIDLYVRMPSASDTSAYNSLHRTKIIVKIGFDYELTNLMVLNSAEQVWLTAPERICPHRI